MQKLIVVLVLVGLAAAVTGAVCKVYSQETKQRGVLKVNHYVRLDGKWDWRATDANGNIVATSGGQGYENRVDCMSVQSNLFCEIKQGRFYVTVNGAPVKK